MAGGGAVIYLDAAATTLQKPFQVGQAMRWAMAHCASVGRGGHAASVLAARVVHECRELAAELFDALPEQTIFTMNATHGLNMAIFSLIPPGGSVLISGFEHNAVLRPLHALGAEITVAGEQLFAPADTLEAFLAAMEKKHFHGVICTQVSNVFGYVLPVEQISAECKRRNIPLIIDASQGAGVLPLSLRQSGAAFIAMPGHKGLYGPQGTGILLCAVPGKPLLYGGTGGNSADPGMPEFLPDRLEAGTHNVCGIAGLAQGLRFVKKQGINTLLKRERCLTRRVIYALRSDERLQLYTGVKQTGVLSLRPNTMSCEELAEELASHGIALRAGLHCAPLAHRSAGTAPEGTLRTSFSAFNTEEEADQFVKILKIILDKRGKSRFTPCY